MSSTADLRHAAPDGVPTSVPPSEKATRPQHPRMPSWDMLGGGADLAEFDVRRHGVNHLEFAEGDAGTNRFSRMYYFLVTRSIVSRWILFIVPVLAVRPAQASRAQLCALRRWTSC